MKKTAGVKTVKGWAVIDGVGNVVRTGCMDWDAMAVYRRKSEAKDQIFNKGERVIPVLITPIEEEK